MLSGYPNIPLEFGFPTMLDKIMVLDHGYVRMENSMGNDLTTANAAKVSFDKRASTISERVTRLISFLGDSGHGSPFRHSTMTFEVYAPMFVKNQWWKYVVGHMHDPMQAWNESSRRYITEEPVFYTPKWRSAPENKKQGSGEPLEGVHHYSIGPISNVQYLDHVAADHYEEGVRLYEEAMSIGVAPEQARAFLPAYAMYVRWWWTCSLEGALHLIEQRTAPDAQWEFQQYARVVEALVRDRWPNSTAALLGR